MVRNTRRGVAVPQAPLLHLAKHRKYGTIQAVLEHNAAADLDDWIVDCTANQIGDAEYETFHGETILHMLMRFRPTGTVVDLLIRRMCERNPGTIPEDSTDLQGRTPLHIAVMHGCDLGVVERLISGIVSIVPAIAKDSCQRLPIHWACSNPRGTSPTDVRRPHLWSCGLLAGDRDNMIAVIQKLVTVYPHCVTVRDRDGKTPMDLALQNRADACTILLLDYAAKANQKNTTAEGMDPSNAGTEDTSFVDILEVTECDDDDMSSIGFGGASTAHLPALKPRSKRKTRQRIEQVQI
jgi:Ankyrin repeat